MSSAGTFRPDCVRTSADLRQDFRPEALDLSGLSNLTSISSTLTIDHSGALDLSPLANLSAVETLVVRNSSGLTGLDGLSGLTELAVLDVAGNESLESLAGLSALDEAPRSLRSVAILDNAALHELALWGVEHVEDQVIVVLNPLLDTCELEERVDAWAPASVSTGNNGPCE